MEICKRAFTLKQAASFSGRETKQRREIEIPNDIVGEVLVRLPAKSIVKFMCVSKHWRSMIKSREFGERYACHQKTKGPKLLFVCDDFVNRAKSTLFLKSVSLGTTYASLEDHRSLPYKNFKGFLEISESCDGLVCIYGLTKAVQVLNPATATSLVLSLARIQRIIVKFPGPELYQEQDRSPSVAPCVSFTRFGFGKDNVTGRYKLVWLYNEYPASKKKEVRCEVLDLQVQTWRFVSTTPLDHHHVLYNQRPAFANGSFYWLTGDEEGQPTTQTKLIVFDIHTEMFQLTETPHFVSREAYGNRIGVCNLHGRLCVSELKGDCTQDFWWRVKDDTWDKIFSVDLRLTSIWFRGITSQPLTPLAICRDNNKVILSLTYEANLVAFDLDPDSAVYHLYYSGYYGLSVPYFPSLSLDSVTIIPCAFNCNYYSPFQSRARKRVSFHGGKRRKRDHRCLKLNQ